MRRSEHDATHVQVNRPLRHEFAQLLAGWEWDVALLQEVPPRWLRDLERATGASGDRVLTSRNSFAPIRAAIAEWNPDLIRSNEGGSNMLLVRPPARVVATRTACLAARPERRVLSMARLERADGRGLVVANGHLSVPATGRGAEEALRAAELAVEWAAGDPVVLGGDLNLRATQHAAAFDALRERYGLAPPTAAGSLDHLLGRAVELVEPPVALPPAAREIDGPGELAIRLSDHAPVTAAFRVR